MKTTTEDLIKKADIQKIADKGTKIYEKIKKKYDPKERGKILAIDVDSGQVYLGDTSVEALISARREHPNKVFYLQKIGFDAVETLASVFPVKS